MEKSINCSTMFDLLTVKRFDRMMYLCFILKKKLLIHPENHYVQRDPPSKNPGNCQQERCCESQ